MIMYDVTRYKHIVEAVTRDLGGKFPQYYYDIKNAAWDALREAKEGQPDQYYIRLIKDAGNALVSGKQSVYDHHSAMRKMAKYLPEGTWAGFIGKIFG